jgi:hypothetical protein
VGRPVTRQLADRDLSIKPQVRAEAIEAIGRSHLPLLVVVEPVEERALLGRHEERVGAAADRFELDRHERHGDPPAVDIDVVRGNDPLALDDVLEDRVVDEGPTLAEDRVEPLVAVNAEILRVFVGRAEELVALTEPLVLDISKPG